MGMFTEGCDTFKILTAFLRKILVFFLTLRNSFTHIFVMVLIRKYGQSVMASGCDMLLKFTDKLTCHLTNPCY